MRPGSSRWPHRAVEGAVKLGPDFLRRGLGRLPLAHGGRDVAAQSHSSHLPRRASAALPPPRPLGRSQGFGTPPRAAPRRPAPFRRRAGPALSLARLPGWWRGGGRAVGRGAARRRWWAPARSGAAPVARSRGRRKRNGNGDGKLGVGMVFREKLLMGQDRSAREFTPFQRSAAGAGRIASLSLSPLLGPWPLLTLLHEHMWQHMD